jgi:uncharacterized membrane protein YcaP (DUF421 family)
MKKGEIHLSDWHRILFGEAPPSFLLEVMIRTVIVYFLLIVILRLMGKRMGGQLTIAEMSVMVTIGAIISIPMQIPDRGLLQGLLVMILALLFMRLLNLFGFKNQKAEELLFGKESVLMKDGVLVLNELEKTRISRQQLYSVLRNENIYNLGVVGRLYLEGSGTFSIFKVRNPTPGLSIFPPADVNLPETGLHYQENIYACINCGKTAENKMEHCANCAAGKYEQAII